MGMMLHFLVAVPHVATRKKINVLAYYCMGIHAPMSQGLQRLTDKLDDVDGINLLMQKKYAAMSRGVAAK